MHPPMTATMFYRLPTLCRLAAVAASIGLRPARAGRTAKGCRAPALDLAVIAPRRAEARDLLAYLDAAGVTDKPGRPLAGGCGASRAGAEIVPIAGHPRRHAHSPLGARPYGSKAEIVPLRHSA